MGSFFKTLLRQVKTKFYGLISNHIFKFMPNSGEFTTLTEDVLVIGSGTGGLLPGDAPAQ
jgi:hypothetical protein